MDSADIFPTVEESSFCSNFQCCGRSLKDLHELLQHYEDSHVRIEDGDEDVLGAGMFDFDTVLAADSLLNVGAEASSSRPSSTVARLSETNTLPSLSEGFITPASSTAPSGSHVKRPRILTLGIEPCDYASDDSEHLSAFDNTVIRPVDPYRSYGNTYNGHQGFARIAPKRSHSVPALPNFPLINGESGFKLIHSILSSTADPPSTDNSAYHYHASGSTSQTGPGAGLLPISSAGYPSSAGYSGGRSSNDRPFVCPVSGCGKTYKNANGLKYHAIHGHDGVLVEKPHKCPFVGCGKRYKNSNGLKYHFQHAHPNAPPPSSLTMNTSMNSSNVGSYSSPYHQRPVSSYASASAPSYASVPIPPRPHSTVPSSSAPVRQAVPVQVQASVPTQIPAVAPAHSQLPQSAQIPQSQTVTPTLSAETVQNLLASAPATIANLLKKNPSLKQHLPTILRNLQQIALQKSNTNNEDKKPSTERPPL